MLNVKILSVHYLIDEQLSVFPTKVLYELTEEELKSIQYEVSIENRSFISKGSDITELGVRNLQKLLPKNVKIASCQTCRYGNFSPYGDKDNEIFCLSDLNYNNRNEVCEIFLNGTDLEKRSRQLLEFCRDYEPISLADYYTYNDWEWK